MSLKHTLRVILEISGKTQEQLAQELGVSFATLNSWINERSIPHAGNLALVVELYSRLTGQAIIPESELRAKKDLLAARARRDILAQILKNSDIYDQFLLSLTYHTNRIEGSTLTENETAAILFDNISLPNKSLVEQLEAKNHQTALKFLFEYLREGKSIDEGLVLKLHGILMNSIRDDAGIFRRHSVRIVGANVPTANYLKVPELIGDLMRDIVSLKEDIIFQAADVHARFEQIHPFSDGNGRIGRLLLDAMLLQKKYPPAIIVQEKRRQYMAYLNKAQQNGETSLLQDFLCDAILTGFDILERKQIYKKRT
jgi:Fic family protein/DNA-binding XRE family transcriptional regulator